ncbi:YfcL family protein [Shewanella corallii]|uniref:YfcL family protein n=2 Tax=Shewanella TaxID=22 RepID=A0ABT0NA89_9GAMM|nr:MULTISPECIES: YfcL family protein [Shewanella]MCL1039938.1 YfcL family protein [Shewanella submarina]MCL2915373.1 YfcL family protein [Shewanella corallii]
MLEKYEQTLDQWIESIVTSGDDDALFASGYLQGHFAVVLAEMEGEGQTDMASLDEKMKVCLNQATRELEDPDYLLVANAWQELRSAILA